MIVYHIFNPFTILSLRIYCNAFTVIFANRTWIFKFEIHRSIQFIFESNIEISNVVFEKIRYFIRIWDNWLYFRFIVCKNYLAYNWGERILKQRNYLLLRFFIITDKSKLSFASLCTPLNQFLGTSVTNANRIYTSILGVFWNKFQNCTYILDSSIS